MISLILDWALFFLVLFFLMPVMMICAMVLRDSINQNRHHQQWHKDHAGKSPS